MMKRTGLLCVVFCIIFTFALPFFAASDVEPSDDSSTNDLVVSDPLENEEPIVELPSVQSSSIDNSCICGREYYTGAEGDHSKYDCIKCGKNMYACTCNCWCGASSVLDTSGTYGSVLPRICSGCNKPCPDCDCRDDKAEVLAAEKLRLNGEVSPLNIPRPENGVNLVISLFVILILSSVAFYLPYAPFLNKDGVNRVEDIDLSEVFVGIDDSDIQKKAEKVYETPETGNNPVNSKSVKIVSSDYCGISVYEKVNLPWITSGNRIIDVNAAAAKIIVNDSEVICGDQITVSEVSEQLMSDVEAFVDREARFPEFFGIAEDELEENEVEQK